MLSESNHPFSRSLSGAALRSLLLLLIPAVLSSGCGGAAADSSDLTQSERLLTVSVAAAQVADDFAITREYQGQIEPRRRSRVGFDLAGVVRAVRVDEGDAVRRGAVLAQLDAQRLDVRRRQAAAAVDEAQTALELATSTLARFEQALDRKAVSPQDLDEARRQRESAAAALRRATAQLDAVDVDLSKSTLRSPYRAQITQRLVDEGEAVGPGQQILELIEVDRPRVRVGVPIDLAADELPETAEFTVGDRTVRAERIAALPEQSAATRTVDVIYELTEELGALRIGQIARLRLASSEGVTGIALPMRALTEASRGLWSALVAVPIEDEEADGAAVHRLESRAVEIIEIGTRDDQPMVTVRGGLGSGELVVMEGLHRLVPGQRVLLADADPVRSDP